MALLSRGALLLCLAGLAAFPQTAEKKEAPAARSALDKATLEAYVRHLFVWGKNINVEVMDAKQSPDLKDFYTVVVRASAGPASQDEIFLVSHDGHKIMRAVIFDVNQNPFKPDLDKLKTQFQPSMGTEGAPVVLVIFTDFECPVCKQEAEMLRQNLLSAYPKEVRLYLKDFPLVQIHPWAKAAAMAGRCVFRQNPAAFWEYHDWVYAHQSEITADNLKAKLVDFAATKDKEIDTMQFNSCVATQATE
ncbi:MAG TPA: thioredoxin domain-containing protein, partial [Bryobacteraceae bacterium]|nr:thioredoxin domain-containing protein [Bryobacteraceae bacterium]